IHLPWVSKKLLWNPEPLGSFFGEICLQAWQQNAGDFGREVMGILEQRLGVAPLEEALSSPLDGTDNAPRKLVEAF
ncbi:MAG: radical SAM protein, partial [Synechococcales cyanobacterium]